MLLTGTEIIELIKKYNLEDRECRFSLPKDIFETRPTKYRRMSQEEIAEEFHRYLHGEKLSDLAVEYGVHPSSLSLANKKYLKRLQSERSMQ